MKKLEEKIKHRQSALDKFFTVFMLCLTAFGIVLYENRASYDDFTVGVLIILGIVSISFLAIILYLYFQVEDLIEKL